MMIFLPPQYLGNKKSRCKSRIHNGLFIFIYFVARGGLEPPTSGLWILCSNQLSYRAILHKINELLESDAKVVRFGKTENFKAFFFKNKKNIGNETQQKGASKVKVLKKMEKLRREGWLSRRKVLILAL